MDDRNFPKKSGIRILTGRDSLSRGISTRDWPKDFFPILIVPLCFFLKYLFLSSPLSAGYVISLSAHIYIFLCRKKINEVKPLYDLW